MPFPEDAFLRAHIRANPSDAAARFALAEYYFQIHQWNSLHGVAEASSVVAGLTNAERGRIVMLEFLAYYLLEKLDESPKYFSFVNFLNEGVQQNPEQYGNMHIFYIYLLRLMQFRESNKGAYQKSASKSLHLIGDSHTLGVHGMVVGDRKCQANLVLGCKAFHVKKHADNQYYGYLQRTLKELPTGSDIVMVLGEIDCRVDGGIVPYALKSGTDIKLVAEKTAREYVECLSETGHNLSFMSVPPLAPQRVMATANQSEGHQRLIVLVRDAIEFFNESLRTACRAHGHMVVDIYQEAIGPNRIARLDTHIDTIHLRPTLIAKAIETSFH